MTELKTNFKNKYDNLNCDLYEKKNKIKEETQKHIYGCKHLKENKGLFSNIFENLSDTKNIKEITKEYISSMKERDKLLVKKIPR